jgi:hypothetical protein
METGYDSLQSGLPVVPTTRESKTKRLIEYLKKAKKINPKQAWTMFGIYRLGARIHDLRRMYHWNIKTDFELDPRGEKYTVYHVILVGQEPK